MTAADTTALLEKLDKPDAWHRDTSFDFHFYAGPETPGNSTSDPDEWAPLFALTPSDLEAIKAALVEREELREVPHRVWEAFQQEYEAEMDLHPREGNQAMYQALLVAINADRAALGKEPS